MKKVRRILAVVMALALVAAMLVACQSAGDAPKPDLHLPFIAPLTGDSQQYGIAMQCGLMLRVEEANEAGGVGGRKIVIDTYDDKNDPKETVNIANMILGEPDLWIVFGPFSTTCAMAVAPLFQKAEVIHWALQSSHPDITKIGDWIFRGTRTQAFETGEFARYATEVLGAKTFSLIYINTDWGKSVEEIFTEGVTSHGGEVLVSESFIEGATRDFTPLITKMWTAEPDMVFIIAMYNDTSTIIKQMATLDVDCIKLMASPNVRQDVIDLTGEDSEGIYSLSGLFIESTEPKYAAFRAKFKERWDGREVETFSVNAYDAMDVTLQIIERVGTDKFKVKEELANLKDFYGVSGTWSFDEMRNPSKPLFPLQIQNGTFVMLDN